MHTKRNYTLCDVGDNLTTKQILQGGDDVQFDELVVYGGAGTKLHSVTDFFANLIKSAGGRQTMSDALRIFAIGSKTTGPIALDTYFKSHAPSLGADFNLVNDPNDNRS